MAGFIFLLHGPVYPLSDMKTAILISCAFLVCACGGVEDLTTTGLIAFKYRDTNQALVFSTATEFVRTPHELSGSLNAPVQIFYIHVGDSDHAVNALPIKSDSVFSVMDGHTNYKFYRYKRYRASEVLFGRKDIMYVDVYFDRGVVSAIKYRWDNGY